MSTKSEGSSSREPDAPTPAAGSPVPPASSGSPTPATIGSSWTTPIPAPVETDSPKPTAAEAVPETTDSNAVQTNGVSSPVNLHKSSSSSGTTSLQDPTSPSAKGTKPVTEGSDKPLALSMTGTTRSPSEDVGQGHPERKRRASNDSLASSAAKSDVTAEDGKDDDEDMDDEDEDKVTPGQNIDPERLKAFNMFCRLFVDENLDRSVPISKQPKDKIQAILEACDRQFPEFHDRARKRTRTYLKSCRRMRRTKDGVEQVRPTPPHLTSAAAEALLAQACENEAQNAKRMRMGLEPLPLMNGVQLQASAMNPMSSLALTTPKTMGTTTSPTSTPTPQGTTPTPAPAHISPLTSTPSDKTFPNEFTSRNQTAGGTAFRPPTELPSPFFANGNGIFRSNLGGSYAAHSHHSTPIIPQSHTNQLQNGPTDLSMKSGKTSNASKNQLNPSEMATIKQLIAGYRESAAFLYRSADELEQLLLQQN